MTTHTLHASAPWQQWLKPVLPVLAIALGLSGVAGSSAQAPAATTRPQTTARTDFLFGPYKDINMAVNPAKPVTSSRLTGTLNPLVQHGSAPLLDGATVLTLAFASGECGSEHWGPLDAQAVADANITSFNQAGLDYIISTGGEGGVFTCASDTGMEAFIARYKSARLVGIDFDIEAHQTQQDIDSLVQRAANAQRRHPTLRWSFTLPTFAASDASGASLNAHGQRVMRSLQTSSLKNYVINLMVMNYGPATPANCVVQNGRCDMAASAAQAVRNLMQRYGLSAKDIAVTAMIGVNDVTHNVFTPADATTLARFAKSLGLAGLHYWSLDRDTPCPNHAVQVSPTCGSLNDVPSLGFAQAFLHGLR